MNALVKFSRIFVGSLFIVSGLIKANDPLGFSYKLGEYFEESALGLPFLEPYALGLAMLACLAEIVLGFAVIFGGRMKLATWSLVGLTVFFGWLTLYTATCDPQGTYTIIENGIEHTRGVTCVTDCGCFGDAMKGSIGRSLTPWESFYKDLILFIFILPIFFVAVLGRGITLNTKQEDNILLPLSLVAIAIFSWVFTWYFPVVFSLIVMALYKLIKWRCPRAEWTMAGMVAVASLLFMGYCINELPMRDYRPYAVGKNLQEQMKTAEEMGLPAPEYVYEYTLVKEGSGEEKVITSKEYMDDKWWEKKEWKLDKSRTSDAIKVKDGYEPPIADFSFQNLEGEEWSYRILEAEAPVLLVLNYDVEKASDDMNAVAELAKQAEDKGIEVFGLSASSAEAIDDFRHAHQLAFPYLQGDEKVIKTIVRDNPGLLFLNKADILGKWSASSAPSVNELQQLIQGS